jgi:hypothetical protein
MQFLKDLIFTSGFIPRGSCCLRTPSPTGVHVGSNSPIALSCLPIPITLMCQFRATVRAPAVDRLRVNPPSLRHALAKNMEKFA